MNSGGSTHVEAMECQRNCEARTMNPVQQAYTPLAGLSDSYVVMLESAELARFSGHQGLSRE